jgi:hypothetical protein
VERIARDLNLKIIPDSPFYGMFPKIGGLLGRQTLCGKLYGKQLTVCVTKFPGCKQFPMRIVARVDLHIEKQFKITARAKPFFSSIHKIFDGNAFFSNNPILDGRLLFFTDDGRLLRAILGYEEIHDQLCTIWQPGKRSGTLIASNNSVIYHEPFGLVTKAVRGRIESAVTLICDVADILKMFGAN